MKTLVVTSSNVTLRFPVRSWEAQPDENKKSGNRNFPPAPNLQTRPRSVPAGWGPASYPGSGLPSSLEEWLASKDALIIG
jgi:hypothetical protein